jgi:hypothetical protein
MIPCLPCESARELIEPLIDRELSTADQVAVEAHLRACPTCSARVHDLGLIGWSIRAGIPAMQVDSDDVRALGVMQSGVLARVHAERSQSWRVQLREQLSDMRLWWPAIGATAAVIACLMGSVTIWTLTTTVKRPFSLAAKLAPGSNSNPVLLDDDMLAPRLLDEGRSQEELSAGDGFYVVSAILLQNGLVDGAELVPSRREAFSSSAEVRAARLAVLEAVRGARFTPAQAPGGRSIAVRVLIVIERTTIREKLQPLDEPQPVQQARRGGAKPVLIQPLPGARSAVQQSSARA